MKVKIYKVIIPAKSSRERDVPRYDIPIIRALWPSAQLIPGRQIEVIDLGITEWRNPDEEFNRLQSEYAAQVDGVPAWKHAFAARADFMAEFRRECADGERLDAEVARFREANAAELDGATAPLLDLGNLDDGEEPERPRRGRPRKQAEPVAV